MKWDFSLIPYTKTKPKWIKNLNIRPETVRLLEENIEGKLHDIQTISNDLMDMILKHWQQNRNRQMGKH